MRVQKPKSPYDKSRAPAHEVPLLSPIASAKDITDDYQIRGHGE